MFDNNRLRQRRLDMGLTLEEVGNVVGISRSAVQKHEKGIIKNVYTSTVELFGKALRCSPAYLMCWEDNPNPPPYADNKKITVKEMEIIEAYRRQPELRVAVEKVLGVYNDTESIKERSTAFKIAAREGKDTIELTPDQVKELARIADEAKNKDNSDLF